jgi:hypothetical protein
MHNNFKSIQTSNRREPSVRSRTFKKRSKNPTTKKQTREKTQELVPDYAKNTKKSRERSKSRKVPCSKVTVDNVDVIHRTETSLSFGMAAILCVQYALAPFFCYPHKLFFHYLFGASYDVAYSHFKRDHRTATNLCLHLVCLGLQISSNFAFAAALDTYLKPFIDNVLLSQFEILLKSSAQGVPFHPMESMLIPLAKVIDVCGSVPLTTLIAVLWSLYLGSTTAPAEVRLVSLVCLWVAYSTASFVLRWWEVVAVVEGLATIVVLK